MKLSRRVFRSWRQGLLAGVVLLGCAGPVVAGGIDQAKAGLTALSSGQNLKAIACLTEALDSNELPDEKIHLFFMARGCAEAAEGEYRKAVADYDQALLHKPGYAAAAYNRGNAHFELRQYDLAIADYSLALAGDSRNAKALNNRGAAWYKKGNLQSAMANYVEAMSLAPDDPDIVLNRGKVYEALGEPEKARADFLLVKRLDPSAKTPLD